MNKDNDDYKQYLLDRAFIKNLTKAILESDVELPADVDFDARQKGRPITKDDIVNLKILLETTEDVNDFLELI